LTIVRENPIARLEESFERLLKYVQDLRAENIRLKEELVTAQLELEELKRRNSEASRELKQLKDERLEIRSRMRRIQENLAALEKPTKETGL